MVVTVIMENKKHLSNINFSILQQFVQDSPVLLKIMGLRNLGTGCDSKGV